MSRRWPTCLFALASLCVPAAAQQPEPKTPEGTEWHVVQPGETLEGLSERFLGDAALWPENWRLNPELKDPHLLQPGQRLLIYTRRPRAAEIAAISRRVEAKPHPDPAWSAAHAGDRLKERDGLRTYERSSADLAFDDGSRLLVTERSLVFLREVQRRLLGEVTKRSFEIVEGQADLDGRKLAADDSAIEIVVGGARTTSRAAKGEGPSTRARKAASGAAQLMVYGGAGQLEAQGARVAVPAGMGAAAPKDGRPLAPEKLLPAPTLYAPAPGTSLDHANPRFSWRPVQGAASYVVEVCRDTECGSLVERATRVTGTRWSADDLPVASLFVRVTAVSPSGLDGYPGTPLPFEVTSLWRRPDIPRP